ncbi:hypothetical protein MMC18_005235 [Xylographa bjoerkii]|nr:hypothetical protein [Xylographa bjoerkii]
MAILEDVEVKIILKRSGQPLVEYDNPDPEAVTKDREVEKYVEAKTEAEFTIQIILKAGFNFHDADGVDVHVNIDGGTLKRHVFQPKPEYLTLNSGKLLQDLMFIKSTSQFKRGEEWYSTSYAFGPASVDEDLHLDKAVLQKQLVSLGSILVKIERVKSYAEKAPCQRTGKEALQNQKLDKKLIVKSISHTFQAITTARIGEPRPRTTKELRLKGKYGKVGKYKFFYRSHTALQYLGCIPTTPEPILISGRAPADLTDKEKIEEIRRLRAEAMTLNDNANSQRVDIQRLMQANQIQAQKLQESANLNEKIAALHSALGSMGNITTPVTTPIPMISSVKRERVKQEPNEDDATPPRAVKRSKPEFVTLDD